MHNLQNYKAFFFFKENVRDTNFFIKNFTNY